MNSFRFIEKAIKYEVNRQIDAYENGTYEDEVVQETRLFDTATGETRSMRGKEDSMDYRYFPDPDLPPCVINDELFDSSKIIPELPDQKIQRYVKELKIKEYDASVIASSIELALFFEDMINKGATAKNSVTLLTVELLGRLKNTPLEDSPIDSKKLSDIAKAMDDDKISGKAAKEVLDFLMTNTDMEVEESIKKLGLEQVSDDSAIVEIIQKVMEANIAKVEEYRGGKDKLFGFFVGQVMKESRGSANPVKVNELLKKELSS
jgi:aspartyl-tRNA(Asn)/glutamyl-tRNA(Gln) amidotransferase subunit B